MGVNVDTGAIPDPEAFHRCLIEGFEEVLALAAPAASAAPAAAGLAR